MSYVMSSYVKIHWGTRWSKLKWSPWIRYSTLQLNVGALSLLKKFMSTLTPLTLATSGTPHLNPFHRTCTAFRGSGLVGSALLCPMPVKGSTGISWMSLCIFRWRPSPSPPGFRGCRLGFVKAKSCICFCALCSSPPLGFCQRQYFPFAAPGHTAVRRFMLHFSMRGRTRGWSH